MWKSKVKHLESVSGQRISDELNEMNEQENIQVKATQIYMQDNMTVNTDDGEKQAYDCFIYYNENTIQPENKEPSMVKTTEEIKSEEKEPEIILPE